MSHAPPSNLLQSLFLPKPRYTGTVAKIIQYLVILIMSLGQFEIKQIIRNGDKRPGIIKLPSDTGENKIHPSMDVNLLHYWPGESNVAYLGTKGLTSMGFTLA